MSLFNILSLFGLDTNNLEIDPTYEHNEFSDCIHVKQKDIERICPNCGSVHVHIDGYNTVTVKHSIISNENKSLIVKLTKIKYKCVDCNHKYYNPCTLVQKNCRISNAIHWQIYDLAKRKISFKDIAEIVKISLPQVVNIFDQLVDYKRRKLSRCVAIDEKKFKNERGKYVTVISNAETGEILDVIAGRSNVALMSYFDKIPQKELDSVEFLTSDMYEGFKAIKQKYMPKATHIIDHFHISRLFTDAITRVRINYMNRYKDDEDIYNFLKKNWRIFLLNFNHSYNNKKALNRYKFNNYYLDLNQAKKHVFSKCPHLCELCYLYEEFNACFYNYRDVPIVEDDLNYIIQKCDASSNDLAIKIGQTLRIFYHELCDTFSIKNKFQITNAVAEGNNNFIDKIIKMSFGMSNFKRFRNRIMHIKR